MCVCMKLESGVLPIIKAYCVQQKLNSIFFPELFPVVFDDGGHVLDMTFIRSKQTREQLRDTLSFGLFFITILLNSIRTWQLLFF